MPKKRLSFKFVAILAFLVFLMVGVLLSPIFRITQIDIIGNNAISREDILAASQLAIGDNIFAFGASGAVGRIIDSSPYIRAAAIGRDLPGNITIQVQERVATANIRLASGNTYLLIDDTGMVLASSPQAVHHLPRITGLHFTSFSIGQYLQLDNTAVFNDILLLSRIFTIYDFFPDMVDFSNPRDIVMFKGPFDIAFGNMEDAQRKVRYLESIVRQSPLDVGFIDVSDPNSPRQRLSR